MADIIKAITAMVNEIHHAIIEIVGLLGFNIDDKMLHFYFMGLVGIVLFIFTDVIFKALAKFGVSILSFIFVFSIIVVVSVMIEIQQKLTGQGNMEFMDIMYGLYGFFLFLGIYMAIVGTCKFIMKKLFKKQGQH